jgi:hypothetical protein
MTEHLGSVSEFILCKAKGKNGTTGLGMMQHFSSFNGVGTVADDASSTSR